MTPDDTTSFRWWTDAISSHAEQVDALTFGFLGLLALLVIPVAVLLPYFVVHYREGRDVFRKRAPSDSRRLEWGWSIIPFLLSLYFFWHAAELFVDQQRPPEDAMEIAVVGKQWMWKFQHPGGQGEIDSLHVPAGVPVRLRMISQDVIHSLFLPALRIKQDVLPDRYTDLWFQAEKTGRYHILCAEFCGTAHSRMRGELVVMEPEAYQAWLDAREPDDTLAARGEKLFRAYGCSGCHGESSVVRAPSLAGLWGSPVPLAEGGTVIADATYVRDSILFPQRHVAAGYRPIMPSFRGQIGEDDLVELVAYIQSLGTRDRRAAPVRHDRDGEQTDEAGETTSP